MKGSEITQERFVGHLSNASKEKNKGGRPQIPIDWEIADNCLIAGSNGVQTAAALGVHEDTLYARCVSEKKMSFTAYSAKKKQKGNSALHAKQFQVAIGGNVSMLIWLGKQRLGQEESPHAAEGFDGTLAELLDAIKELKKDDKEPREEVPLMKYTKLKAATTPLLCDECGDRAILIHTSNKGTTNLCGNCCDNLMRKERKEKEDD